MISITSIRFIFIYLWSLSVWRKNLAMIFKSVKIPLSTFKNFKRRKKYLSISSLLYIKKKKKDNCLRSILQFFCRKKNEFNLFLLLKKHTHTQSTLNSSHPTTRLLTHFKNKLKAPSENTWQRKLGLSSKSPLYTREKARSFFEESGVITTIN